MKTTLARTAAAAVVAVAAALGAASVASAQPTVTVQDADTAPRIIGGHPAPAGSWPSIAALVQQTGSGAYFRCGSTVIAPNWVLTAAHCTDGAPASSLAVIVGTHNLNSGGTWVGVSQIHQHPSYDGDPQSPEYDLSLLKLAQPVTVTPMPIASSGLASLWSPGLSSGTAGWGVTNSGNPSISQLLEVTLPTVSDADCQASYGASFKASIMLCAGNLTGGGVDACQGDSGGPLTVPDAAGQPVQAGITSWGRGCALPGFPGVWAEIAALRGFVDSTIGWSIRGTVNPTSVAFGETPGPAPKTVRLRSGGNGPLSVRSVTLTGPNPGVFKIVEDPCSRTSLSGSESCLMKIDRRDNGYGGQATLTFNTDASTPVTVALTADGPAPPAPPEPPAPPAPPAPPSGGGGGGGGAAPPAASTPAPAPVTPAPVLPPPSLTPAADSTTPTARAAVGGLSRSRTGRARILVTVDAPGTVHVKVTTDAKTKHKKAKGTAAKKTTKKSMRVVIATRTATFTEPASRQLTLKATRKGRRAMRSRKPVKTRVVVTTVSAGGQTTTTRSTATLPGRPK